MANQHEDHLIQCPFYKTNDRTVIKCGKRDEDGVALRMDFKSHEELVKYKSGLCRRGCWGECFLAKLLNARWGHEL